MGSGGSGGSSGSGGSPAGGGWGPTMGSGGNAYGRGGVGGIGTAGTMSSGAGGSAMGGFGNTGAGGSGMAGISTHSGETPAGFTPAYGDARGLALGMNANGTYGGPGIRENGQTVYGYRTSLSPTGEVKYRTVIQRLTPSKTPGFGYNQWGNLVKMNTPLPTQTNPLTVRPGQVVTPGLLTPDRNYRTRPGIDPGMQTSPESLMSQRRSFEMGNLTGPAPGSGSTAGPNRAAKGSQSQSSNQGAKGGYGGATSGSGGGHH